MHDVAVIGLGVMGASITDYLARQGVSVVGLDQFTPPHKRGSSTGQTRLFRLAYAEGAYYVPLLKKALIGWHDLNTRSGETIFIDTGIFYAGCAAIR